MSPAAWTPETRVASSRLLSTGCCGSWCPCLVFIKDQQAIMSCRHWHSAKRENC